MKRFRSHRHRHEGLAKKLVCTPRPAQEYSSSLPAYIQARFLLQNYSTLSAHNFMHSHNHVPLVCLA